MQTDLEKADVIGMGSYNSDSHSFQRLAPSDAAVENEADMQVAVSPYQIPYRAMIPKREQVVNLWFQSACRRATSRTHRFEWSLGT